MIGRRRTTDDRRPIAGWGGDLVLALVAALAAVALVTLGFARAWPLQLDIGGRDARFILGFHEVEQLEGQTGRWTAGDAEIALPRPPAGANAVLELRVLSDRPAGQPDAHARLSADGAQIGAFVTRSGVDSTRIYRALVPANSRLDWAARIGLGSDVITLPNDRRELGVAVESARLVPLSAGLALPSLWLLAWSAALGLLGYALPRSIGAARGPALLAAVALAALVAWGIAARPMEQLPFVQRIPALLGLGCLGVWLARLLAPPVAANHRQQTADSRQQTADDSRRSPVGGRQLPITNIVRVRPRSSASQFSGQQEAVGGRQLAEDSPAHPFTRSPLHPLTPSPAHPFTRSPARTVRGEDLPIYLAVASWIGPLFQLFMTADGATNVRPPIPTQWIGGIAALLLLGALIWRALRGERAVGTIRRAALAIFAAAALAHLGYMVWFAFQRQGPDFWILFKGARDWARGGSLYNIPDVIENHFGHVFKVPPFYGMLFVPFVFQDGERILFFHRLLNTLLLAATALAWFRMWRLPLFSAAGAGVLILLNFRPMADTMAFGQIDLALLLALTLALWALREERDIAAGALIALGTLFKIYPVLLLAFLVVKGRWRALAGFALGMLVFNGVAVAVMGWEMHRVYLTEVLPRIGGTTSWVENQTISGFLARFVAPPTASEIFRDRAVALLGTAISGLVGLLGCALALRPAASKSTTFALQYSQFALLMVLVVPAAWMHYETLLFLPFAALLLHMRDREVSLPQAAVLALSFALVAYGNQWSFYDGTVMGVLTVAGVSYKFYGMLLLGGVLAATLLAERAPAWEDVARAIPWLRPATR